MKSISANLARVKIKTGNVNNRDGSQFFPPNESASKKKRKQNSQQLTNKWRHCISVVLVLECGLETDVRADLIIMKGCQTSFVLFGKRSE